MHAIKVQVYYRLAYNHTIANLHLTLIINASYRFRVELGVSACLWYLITSSPRVDMEEVLRSDPCVSTRLEISHTCCSVN